MTAIYDEWYIMTPNDEHKKCRQFNSPNTTLNTAQA